MATAREVFETNTFGVMALTQAVLPQLRARRSGVSAPSSDLAQRRDFARLPRFGARVRFSLRVCLPLLRRTSRRTTGDPPIGKLVTV